MAETMGYMTIKVAPAVLKATSIKTDSESVPHFSMTFEVVGRAAVDALRIADIASLIGKVTTLEVKDNQLRLVQEG